MKPNPITRGNCGLTFVTRTVALICLTLLAAAPIAWAQSIDTGAIIGTARDADGAPLPGVTITISSPARGISIDTVTNESGGYRFTNIRADTYNVEAKLEGFKTALQNTVVLTVTRTLTVDFAMEIGSFEDTIEVEGAPIIDIQDSQLITTELPNEVLMDIPTERTIRSIVRLSPGVHSADPDGGAYSAFGSSDQGIQYSIDGVIINSPEAGETELNLDFMSLEDVSVLGLGAPAEYDGFSGVIVNVTTKSGTNNLTGLAELWWEDNSWQSSNTDNPDLERGGVDQTSTNFHFNIGGPISRDKLWFFTSMQYLDEDSPPDPGFEDGLTNEAPRVMGKINWNPGSQQRQSFTGTVEYSERDTQNIGSDEGGFFAPGTEFDNEQTQWYWNFVYTNLLSEKTVLEAKFGGYHQRQSEIPGSGDTPGRYDEFFDMLFDNWVGPFEANRERYQGIFSVSHFTDNFIKGSHDFKFGAEIEQTEVNTLFGYSGGQYFISVENEPYLRYDTTGYNTFAVTDRTAGYVQDSWTISPKIRLNLGLRINYWRGDLSSERNGELVDLGTVYKPDIGIAPRIGFNWVLNDRNTSVFKAHYGRYYHQVTSLTYSRVAPESDLSVFIWDEEEEEYVHEFTEVRDPDQFRIGDDISVAYMDSFVIGYEQAINSILSFDVSATYRTNKDFFDKVNLTGEFEPEPYTDPTTGQQFTVFNQLNPGENQFLMTNVVQGKDYGQAYRPITNFNQERKYQGITASMNKRWSSKWQLQASYTYGNAEGSDDNILQEFGEGRSSSLGGSDLFTNPNSQINANGNLTIDPKHLLNVVGSTELPWRIIVGGFFRYFGGNTYNEILPVPDIDPGNRDIYGIPAGSLRIDDGFNLDLRVAKDFGLGKGGQRYIGVGVDIFNVTNESTPIDVEQTVDSEQPFGSTIAIVRPRTFRITARLGF